MAGGAVVGIKPGTVMGGMDGGAESRGEYKACDRKETRHPTHDKVNTRESQLLIMITARWQLLGTILNAGFTFG